MNALSVVLAGSLMLAASSAGAVNGGTTRYFYDDRGQLIKVVDPAGNVAEYLYDPAGNIVEIRRSDVGTPDRLAIFGFTPQRGLPLSPVVIDGQGFSPTNAANDVRFAGEPAHVQSASPSRLLVLVPPKATSGPISVSVAGSTAITTRAFTVLPRPVVLSVHPPAILRRATATIEVRGVHFHGATFSFLPDTPPRVVVQSAEVNLDGTAARLTLAIDAQALGDFAVIANAAERSPEIRTPGNTFSVLDPSLGGDGDSDGLSTQDEITRGTDPANPDTDGDRYVDGFETLLGSDPLSAASVPSIPSAPRDSAARTVVSILNRSPIGRNAPQARRDFPSSLISILNTTTAGRSAVTPRDTTGSLFSTLNRSRAGRHGLIWRDAFSPLLSIKDESP